MNKQEIIEALEANANKRFRLDLLAGHRVHAEDIHKMLNVVSQGLAHLLKSEEEGD